MSVTTRTESLTPADRTRLQEMLDDAVARAKEPLWDNTRVIGLLFGLALAVGITAHRNGWHGLLIVDAAILAIGVLLVARWAWRAGRVGMERMLAGIEATSIREALASDTVTVVELVADQAIATGPLEDLQEGAILFRVRPDGYGFIGLDQLREIVKDPSGPYPAEFSLWMTKGGEVLRTRRGSKMLQSSPPLTDQEREQLDRSLQTFIDACTRPEAPSCSDPVPIFPSSFFRMAVPDGGAIGGPDSGS